MLALITGINIHPSTAPKHHTGVLLPKAKIKFSVLMENSRELRITRTRLFGSGNPVTRILPNMVAIPVTVLIMPKAISPPPVRDSIIAGKAALKMDAVKLMTAKSRIRSRIPRLLFRYCRPLLEDCSTDSLSVSLLFMACGILIKNSSATKAVAKVSRSNRMTT
jgi:hypothetical protein